MEKEIKKSVKKALHDEIPNFGHWRNTNIKLGSTGCRSEHFRHFWRAFAMFDEETGECSRIDCYCVGDGMPERYYYGWSGTVEITDVINDWYDDYTSRNPRGTAIDRIAAIITSELKEAEDE